MPMWISVRRGEESESYVRQCWEGEIGATK